MDMYALIASEFNIFPPDTTPVYQLMYLAKTAETRRDSRLKAAKDGLVWVG
jgi:hypothetical protein